jgi:hypothetical protein
MEYEVRYYDLPPMLDARILTGTWGFICPFIFDDGQLTTKPKPMEELIATAEDSPSCEMEQPLRKQLLKKQTQLEKDLKTVNTALKSLDANPAIAQVLETVRDAIRL